MGSSLDAEYDWLLNEFQQSLDKDARSGSRSNRTIALKRRIEAILRTQRDSTASPMAHSNIDTVATCGTPEAGNVPPVGMRH